MESTFILEADEMSLAHIGEHYRTLPGPAVAGGRRPPHYSKQIFTRANGEEEEGGGALYVLKMGEKLACYCQGGCGVGDPLDREVESVKKDVLNDIVSPESAREIYGVVLNPKTLEIDKAASKKLRLEKKKQG